jgi:dipeptidyl aminopeptidase/acylaminoacyl peptidase
VAIGFAPLLGDTRLITSNNRTGVHRPSIWEVSTGSLTALPADGLDGDIQAAGWSPDGRRLLLVQLTQAAQRLHIYEVPMRTLTPLHHSSGTYNQVCFGSNSAIFAVWEDSRNPPQVVVLDSATGELARSLLPVPDVPRCHRWRSISFRSSDDQQIQGWLAVPQGDGPFPAILHVHGGPEFAMTELFYPSSQMWLDHGFAFLSINYRGSTTFGRAFLERIWGNIGHWEVEDMVAGRDWLIQEKIGDPARIFVTGSSYGGYLTLQALGTKPNLWAGGMASIAVADWAMAQEDTTETLRGLRAARFGGMPEERPEVYAASSPLTYAAHVTAPALIIQGRNDTRTPPRSVAVYEEKMKALGKVIDVHWFDAGHGSLIVEQAIEHHELMLRFARRIAGMAPAEEVNIYVTPG